MTRATRSPMKNVIDDAAQVIDDAGTRRGRLREAQARWRARRRPGLVTRRLELEHDWLDALEESGSWRARLEAAAEA
jgi:hypothetical protein